MSWSPPECGSPVYLSVYARVSYGYDFIRAQVCDLSDAPPDYFLCSELPPRPEQMMVMVQIQLDSYPSETSWYIKDVGNEIVFRVGPDAYPWRSANVSVTEHISLNAGATYTLVLEDAARDGSK